MNEYIVTVMARDRVGIVRDVSTALSGIGGNITDVSQTVMRDYFTLIVAVSVPEKRTQLEIRQAVERMGSVGELEVNVRPYEKPKVGTKSASERFTLAMKGKDRPGIIGRAATYLAEQGINVDDFYAYVLDGRFVMLVQVSICAGANIEDVQSELERIGHEYDLSVTMQHENIFRATSEVRPIFDLQRGR
ncbi:MAG: glycine cleavage system transcriptional repressor [Armatimonadota bacterium]